MVAAVCPGVEHALYPGCLPWPPSCQHIMDQWLLGHEQQSKGGEGVLALAPPLTGLALLAQEGFNAQT